MAKRGSGDSDLFWLWDGAVEYEGQLVSPGDPHLTARTRVLRRWTKATGSAGRPVPRDFLERHRLLTRRISFAQSPAILMGALLEFQIETVQPSRDRQFDLVISGTFRPVADEHLEALSQLSSDEAFHYLESRRKGIPLVEGWRSGKPATSSGT